MATKDEIFNLMKQYTKFDDMFMKAVAADNRAEAEDIKLQMGKIREKLDTMGVITTPPQDEQPS